MNIIRAIKRWLRLEHEDCSKLPEKGTPHQIALRRCDCLIDQYLRWKRKNLWKSDLAQRAALIFTAITPVLLLTEWDHAKIIGAAASAMAAIATGLLAISGWRENFVRYGYESERLSKKFPTGSKRRPKRL